MNIIGVSYDYFISSACLLSKNKLVFASPEERFNRQKNSKNFPIKVINYIKYKYRNEFKKINYFANSTNPGVLLKKFNPLISSQKRHFSEHLISFPDNILNLYHKRDELNSIYSSQSFNFGKFNLQTFYINHHDAHAANSFYQSKFKKALTFVFDLQGEIACSSVYICEDGIFKKIYQEDYPNSLGMLYATMTEYLGFKANSDEWKVMAISNYSNIKKNEYYKIFRDNIVDYNKFGKYQINLSLFNGYYPQKAKLYNDKLIDILGLPENRSEIPTNKQVMIANALQRVIEEITQGIVQTFANKTKIKNICFSGGLFMNCLMNGRLEKNLKNLNFFIPYAPDDSGNSIGAALYLQKNILKNERKISGIDNPYLGIEYTSQEILNKLKKYKLKYKKLKNVSLFTADLLFKGYIIGWFQGNSEFGQRALGNRSILANPLIPNVKDNLNLAVKYREKFRPFAPAILAEKFKYYALTRGDSKVNYMEKIYYVKKKHRKKLLSICHTDGSARFQTVDKDTNKNFYNLISEFEKKTGYPILINTSFNIKDEPIVNSPEDAIRTFFNSGLDYLIIGDYVIKK
jgi:carbamoyltransferase